MAYVELQKINKRYGAIVALKDVDLSIEEGEVRALLGGNGSGKSTISKIIGGIVEKDSGRIIIDGNDVSFSEPAAAKNKGIAVTAQELSLFNEMTVEENLSLINMPKKAGLFHDKQKSREKILEALEKVNMEETLHLKVKKLTDNQKYLIEMAKALLSNPKILIVDEITSALRREEVGVIKEIVNELSGKGCVIIFITHRINEIFDICHSVTVLKNGELVNTYKTKEVTEDQLLFDMVGEDIVFSKNKVAEDKTEEKNNKIIFKAQNIAIPGFENAYVNLELAEGEVVGITGLQGQGQSALLKELFGLGRKNVVEISGKQIELASAQKAVKEGIAYLSGDRANEGTFIGRSIAENLDVVNETVLRRKKINQEEVLKENGVKYGKQSDAIESLSGGNQQKVVIGRWAITNPKVLLADDPTKGIDVLARKAVHEKINELSKMGSAVIFVSSDDEELVTLASRVDNYSVFVMYGGKIVKHLKGENISTANIIGASVPFGKEGKQ